MGVALMKGLFETHLMVSDLQKSMEFYRDVIGLQVAHQVPERNVVFLWIGKPGHAMLGLWSNQTSPLKIQLHLAFSVDAADVISAVTRLRNAGIIPRNGSGQATEEPDVIGWMPALSIYFDDPDGHSLELISMLNEEPRLDVGFVALSHWRATTSTSV